LGGSVDRLAAFRLYARAAERGHVESAYRYASILADVDTFVTDGRYKVFAIDIGHDADAIDGGVAKQSVREFTPLTDAQDRFGDEKVITDIDADMRGDAGGDGGGGGGGSGGDEWEFSDWNDAAWNDVDMDEIRSNMGSGGRSGGGECERAPANDGDVSIGVGDTEETVTEANERDTMFATPDDDDDTAERNASEAPQRARYWMRRAALAGHGEAQVAYAGMLANDIGGGAGRAVSAEEVGEWKEVASAITSLRAQEVADEAAAAAARTGGAALDGAFVDGDVPVDEMLANVNARALAPEQQRVYGGRVSAGTSAFFVGGDDDDDGNKDGK
jgi:hypothetical protein